MYISQVTFETINENEEILKNIMKNKMTSAKSTNNVINVECWKQSKGDHVAYTLVIHWENQESFREWMKEEHSPAHRQQQSKDKMIEIKKSGAQYEVVEL